MMKKRVKAQGSGVQSAAHAALPLKKRPYKRRKYFFTDEMNEILKAHYQRNRSSLLICQTRLNKIRPPQCHELPEHAIRVQCRQLGLCLTKEIRQRATDERRRLKLAKEKTPKSRSDRLLEDMRRACNPGRRAAL